MTCLLCALLGAGGTLALCLHKGESVRDERRRLLRVAGTRAWLEPHAAPRDTDQSI